MACPDKKTDAQIIAEVQRRKAFQQKTKLSATNEYLYVGDLMHHLAGVNLSEIRSIENLDNNNWRIVLT